MPLRFTFVPELELVLETAEAEITGAEVLSVRLEEAESPQFADCRLILTDARKVDRPSVRPEDLHRLAEFVQTRSDVYRGKRWAFLMNEATPTGLALMLAKLFTDRGILEAQVFSTMHGACDWLGIAPLED